MLAPGRVAEPNIFEHNAALEVLGDLLGIRRGVLDSVDLRREVRDLEHLRTGSLALRCIGSIRRGLTSTERAPNNSEECNKHSLGVDGIIIHEDERAEVDHDADCSVLNEFGVAVEESCDSCRFNLPLVFNLVEIHVALNRVVLEAVAHDGAVVANGIVAEKVRRLVALLGGLLLRLLLLLLLLFFLLVADLSLVLIASIRLVK